MRTTVGLGGEPNETAWLNSPSLPVLTQNTSADQFTDNPMSTHQTPLDDTAAPTTPRLLLTAKQAAEALAISPRKLWELTNCGTIKAVRIGKAVRYATSTLQEFIAGQLA